MELTFLALLCRIYNLGVSDFNFLKTRKTREIFEFIAFKKERPRSVLLSELREWHRRHIQWSSMEVLYPGHAFYPAAFEVLPEPPVYLSTWGDLHLLRGPQVSVVGSRKPHFRFIEWLETQFAEFLLSKDFSVVSGGAFGIDQKVSRLALLSGRRTVQILPSGLSCIYPAAMKSWMENPRVLCLSEYPPDQPMRKHHFVVRNRLVAGLGSFLFLVQAAQKSGSMITARYARDYGREVATLPDFPGVIESTGNLSMIRDGAQIIESAQDLITIYERLGLGLNTPSPERDGGEHCVGHP